MDWLLVLGLEEGLVKCATLCIKSWVILKYMRDAGQIISKLFFVFLCLIAQSNIGSKCLAWTARGSRLEIEFQIYNFRSTYSNLNLALLSLKFPLVCCLDIHLHTLCLDDIIFEGGFFFIFIPLRFHTAKINDTSYERAACFIEMEKSGQIKKKTHFNWVNRID